ncbi:MAG TPA: hypothetical protein VN736_27580 [Candidatus Limnocylindrales bacterium]|nr:hypothetical protein [Candidatus Limnocylindrales bacterium]
MEALVRQARRRMLHNELLAQGATAGSAALAAFILLLLTGTQVLNWQWLVLIPAAALAYGIWRARKRLPSLYRVAQIVDRRLDLSDTLSTAWFFAQSREAKASPDVMRTQAERAHELARTADVRQAVPYAMPRTAYLMAALVLVASSLFALRYGLTRTLDLKQPLASMLREQFGWQPKPQLAKNERRNPAAKPDAPDDNSLDGDQKDSSQPEQNPEAAQDGAQDSNQASGNKKEGGQKNGQDQQAQNGDDKGNEPEPQPENAEGSQSNQNPQNGQQGNKQSDQQQQGSQQQASGNGDSNSLMSKVKDAVQNLLSRVKPPQNQQQGQEQAKNQQQNGQQNNGKQNGQQNKQQQNGDKPGDAQEGQNGDQAKNQQDPQGKGAGKSDSQQASKQPGSGIGSQDGDKSIKQAEQLAAMGKISEILGKRSANISGEATVEVQSTSQQLKTAYVNRGAEHTQGGAEISRDEVPVALQAYVEQYFEQIRKQKK